MLTYRKICLLFSLMKWIKGTNCFKFLKRRLPANVTRGLNSLLSLRCKIAVCRTEVKFHQQCIQSNQFPTQFTKMLSIAKLPINHTNLVKLCESKIDASRMRLDKLLETLPRFRTLLNDLSLVSRIKFENCFKEKVRYTENNTSRKMDRTLNHPTLPALDAAFDQYVHNLTDINFSKSQMEVFGFGVQLQHTTEND